MEQILCGTTLELKAVFRDENGVLTDPDTVTGEIREPDSEDLVDLTVTNPSPGVYVAQYTPLTNGLYQYRFSGVAGPITGGVENSFYGQTQFQGELT